MTEDAIRLAIKHVINQCESGEYRVTTLRGILWKDLKYPLQEVDEIIQYVADHGFNYCVDPMIPLRSDSVYPSLEVCHYGVDQLASRLRSLR